MNIRVTLLKCIYYISSVELTNKKVWGWLGMGTRWINSLYAVAILLTIGPFLWSVSFNSQSTFKKYIEMLKNRRRLFVINLVLGIIFSVLVIINKGKFLWYIGLVTSTEFRPYDNYYPTLAITLFMILGGTIGIIMGLVKHKR
jgi:hypothetical protein